MKKVSSMIKLGVISAVVAMGMSGCAVKTGNKAILKMSKEDMDKTIVKGKTTKTEISKVLGQAQSVDFTATGDEKWIYKSVRSQAKITNFIPIVGALSSGSDEKTRTLVIIFDKQGVVKNYSYSIAEGETVGGLIGG
ncbi:hypothetical protein MNB_SV-14-1332 [hydrothermal vent metagenome]|uniref:Lipoprotein SmpA/OmlA domain-containing protein n=1 Tax=hydrothermal vent metagenome TaxID=652676 RepID=A0A1W1BUZ0_9ZZZZ